MLLLNENLLDYEVHLSPLQMVIAGHIVEEMQGTVGSFYRDCQLFTDLCQVYKGNFFIIERPRDFEPVREDGALKKLMDQGFLYVMRNQVKIQIGPLRTWTFLLNNGERYFFDVHEPKPRNLLTDPDNPLKMSFYMV